MDILFCLPVLLGCQTKLTPEGDQTPRVCPRCHNASVASVKSRMWFQVCFVPLVPMTSKHQWSCTICQWNVPKQEGWEPAMINNQPPAQGPPGWHQPPNANHLPVQPVAGAPS